MKIRLSAQSFLSAVVLKAAVLFFLLPAVTLFSSAQDAPPIEWQRSYGGSGDDEGYNLTVTNDGGYILAGYSDSNDGDVTGNHGNDDAWIVKVDAGGNVQWQKSYGGSKTDQAFDIIQTSDGNYVFAGLSSSHDGDLTGNHGFYDCWIVKIDTDQQIIWQKNYGGSQSERAVFVEQTFDGGYAVAGFTSSDDFDVTGHHDSSDYWIMKLDTKGDLVWQKCLGGSKPDWGSSMTQLADGGYIVAGRCRSNDGDVTGNHGDYDSWLARLDSSGNIIWQRSYGGSDREDDAYAIPTSDGGFIVGAISLSLDGDVAENKGVDDYWILRLNSSGDILWQKSYGGCCDDDDYYITPTSDHNYLIAGHTFSDDQDVTGYHGQMDYWLIKIDTLGNLLWQKDMGGSQEDGGQTGLETPDGGYIIVGRSASNDFDVSGNHGGIDYWVVKLSTATTVQPPLQQSVNIFPSPATDVLNISFENITSRTIQVLICDPLGREVYSSTSVKANTQNQFTLDVSALTQGIYFIDIKQDAGTVRKKFMIVK